MRIRRFGWSDPRRVAAEVRGWFGREAATIDLSEISSAVSERGDDALRELTSRFDAGGVEPARLQLTVPIEAAERALAECGPEIRAALELAGENIRSVARAQLDPGERVVQLPQGHSVAVGQTPVASAGIYAPGGRAAYPSTVLMGCITAREAGVERVVLVSPPGPDGGVNPTTLAAAALCRVDSIHAVGGAQAIFALARGTATINPVDVIAGPGNAWVQAAKREVFGEVGIDSLAGPSDLTVVLDDTVDPAWAALDLCAQAEHGAESPLVAIAVGPGLLDRLEAEVERVAGEHPGVNDCRLALSEAPDAGSAVRLADAIAPEHLQLMDAGSAALEGEVRTAGCVFLGPFSGTAFGDYVAGSNHVLPTDGTGRFFGPLSPQTFRRPTARVSLDAASVGKLAGPLAALAEREGLPVHGLSATARAADDRGPNRR